MSQTQLSKTITLYDAVSRTCQLCTYSQEPNKDILQLSLHLVEPTAFSYLLLIGKGLLT